MGSRLGCIPIDGGLTPIYLRTIQLLSASEWNAALERCPGENLLWRDGESPFLLPDGIEREAFWLANCAADRIHLAAPEYEAPENEDYYRSYPIHSFADWMKELRMVGYVERVRDIERNLRRLPALARHLWLLTINSDILSSVEKKSPLVTLRSTHPDGGFEEFRIFRSERSFEGEEYLTLLERGIRCGKRPRELTDPPDAHLLKAEARLKVLSELELPWTVSGRRRSL